MKCFQNFGVLKGALIFLGISVFASCSNENSEVSSYKILHPEMLWGEFLRAEDADTFITVSRGSEHSGLLRYHIRSDKFDILDSSATDAKDIFVSHGVVIFRQGSELRASANSHSWRLTGDVKRLRSFEFDEGAQEGLATYDGEDKKFYWIRFNLDTTSISIGNLSGSVRASFRWAGALYFALSTPTAFGISKVEPKEVKLGPLAVVSSHSASYAATSIGLDQKLKIYFLDDEDENIKWSELDLSEKSWAFKTYVLDSQLRQDLTVSKRHVFGVSRDLRLRWTELRAEGNRTLDLPFEGAVGFYPQILSENATSVTLAFHNFRTQKANAESTFENLAIATIQLH